MYHICWWFTWPCIMIAHVRRRRLCLEWTLVLYNSLPTALRASRGLVDAPQQTLEPPPHQSRPHSSADEARLVLWRAVQVYSSKDINKQRERKKRRIPFNEGYIETKKITPRRLLWRGVSISEWSSTCSLSGGWVAEPIWGCGVFVCVSGSQEVWHRVSVSGSEEVQLISSPKRGHFRSLLQSCMQPTACPTVPSSLFIPPLQRCPVNSSII